MKTQPTLHCVAAAALLLLTQGARAADEPTTDTPLPSVSVKATRDTPKEPLITQGKPTTVEVP